MLARIRMTIPPGNECPHLDMRRTRRQFVYVLKMTPDRGHGPSHRADCRGRPVRCRHRTTPSRAFRLLGSQTRTAFQLNRASSGCPSFSNNVASSHRRQDIGGTDRQGILKPTDSCDPFLARRIGSDCWWFHRAFSFHCHARAPLLFGLLSHAGLAPFTPDVDSLARLQGSREPVFRSAGHFSRLSASRCPVPSGRFEKCR